MIQDKGPDGLLAYVQGAVENELIYRQPGSEVSFTRLSLGFGTGNDLPIDSKWLEQLFEQASKSRASVMHFVRSSLGGIEGAAGVDAIQEIAVASAQIADTWP